MLKALSALGAVAAASLLLLPTASLAGTVSYDDDVELVQASVSYADLNLAQPQAVSTLHRRISWAAKGVCGIEPTIELHKYLVGRQCFDGAMASAQPAFDEAVAAARSGTVTITYGASLIVTAPH